MESETLREPEHKEPNNFASFYTRAMKNKKKKIKKGKYKGQMKGTTSQDLAAPGPAVFQKTFDRLHAPSASTYTVKG
jgi:hypothetical protein